jgi:hypothetical protein
VEGDVDRAVLLDRRSCHVESDEFDHGRATIDKARG